MSQNSDRRRFLRGIGAGAATAISPAPARTNARIERGSSSGREDRAWAVELLRRMAEPVVGRMSRGRLQAEWRPELSPTWDGRDARVAYLEAFGRLASGISPWLALADDGGPEGRLRAALRIQVLESYVRSVDPGSPDRLFWEGPGQALVDSAFYTSALLRAPNALWEPLDKATKSRIAAAVKGLRRVSPPIRTGFCSPP